MISIHAPMMAPCKYGDVCAVSGIAKIPPSILPTKVGISLSLPSINIFRSLRSAGKVFLCKFVKWLSY